MRPSPAAAHDCRAREAEGMKIQVVSMKDQCTACYITENLVKEVVAECLGQFPGLELEVLSLDHPSRCRDVPGLEIEKFPAVLINGWQVSAGKILLEDELIELISMETGKETETENGT